MAHSWTYVCPQCGSLRRRERLSRRYEGSPPPEWPRCCDVPMQAFDKVQAEAVTKLTRAERVKWIAAGAHVFQRPGRRWTAALTERQMATAQEQVAAYQAAMRPAT